jgi:hypothetical protein
MRFLAAKPMAAAEMGALTHGLPLQTYIGCDHAEFETQGGNGVGLRQRRAEIGV